MRRASPCGGRGQRPWRCARASYLKTRCRSRETASGSKKRPPSNRYADVNGGLAETTVFGKTSTASSRRKSAARGPMATNHRSRASSREAGPSATARAAGVARRRSRNVSLDGSRVRLRSGEAFTGRVAKRSRHHANVWAAAKGFASRHARGVRQARHWVGRRRPRWNNKPPRSCEKQTPSVDPPEPHRRRETAGCSIAGPSGLAAGAEPQDSVQARRRTSPRANEARVLEIEAADGRNRSYASRVKHGPRRKPGRESRTLAQASTEQPR